VIDAISGCVPVAAALVQIVNLDAPGMVSGHVVRLPMEIVQGWMSTPRAHMARAFGPLVQARDGDFWRAQDLATSVRERLAVLEQLDRHGLGEGAGYKVSRRPGPSRGTEHVSLALLAERKQRFSPRAGMLLRELAPAIRAAMDRLTLPLVATRPLVGQMMEEDAIGFIVTSRSGALIELNRRAYDLVREHAITRGRRALTDFVDRALTEVSRARAPFYVRRGDAILEVRRHDLRADTQAIADDAILLTLRKIDLGVARAPFAPPPGVELSPRERDVAELLTSTGLTYEGIGERLSIKEGTVRAIVPAIYRAYGVRSRQELVRRQRGDEG
jgi:DNA-binding CsgD family transcriptional regulator